MSNVDRMPRIDAYDSTESGAITDGISLGQEQFSEEDER